MNTQPIAFVAHAASVGSNRGDSAAMVAAIFKQMDKEILNFENGTKVIKPDDFVFLNDHVKRRIVRASQISILEVDGNYTMVHLNDATSVLIKSSIRRLERRLHPSTFFRASRKCIVNLACVEQIKPCGRRQFIFVLTDGKHVELSRQRTLRFQKENAL